MEALFNLVWALVGVLGIAAAVAFRRRLGPWTRRELVRDLLLLAVIAFVLFPVVSMSDDVGYFTYYFSGGRVQDGLCWVIGPRRETPLAALAFLQAFAALLTLILVGAPRSRILATVAPAEFSINLVGRKTTALLRAPPSSLF